MVFHSYLVLQNNVLFDPIACLVNTYLLTVIFITKVDYTLFLKNLKVIQHVLIH